MSVIKFPCKDCAGFCVNLKFIPRFSGDDFAFVHGTSIIAIRFKFGNASVFYSGQYECFGLFGSERAKGGYAAAGIIQLAIQHGSGFGVQINFACKIGGAKQHHILLQAVIAFQKAEGIKADGKYGSETHEALMDAVADDDEGKKEEEPEETPSVPVEPEAPAEPTPVGTTVVIVAEGGGKVNVRVGNDTSYKRITTVPAGTTFEYVATAANGWNAVVVAGQVGWVSGKYSKVV